jgi:hypothetical protein
MRKSARLAALAAAAGAGALVLLSTGAASAATQGTTGPGSWQFLTFDQNWNYTDGIQLPHTSTSSSTSTVYRAQVQQPINADGTSIFSAKSRTIPVKFQVQKQDVTTTTTSTTPGVWPGTMVSNATGTPATTLSFDPSGTVTLSQISDLMANFSMPVGHDHNGSLRWSLVTSAGTFFVYYGDPSSSFQTGGNEQSGANMTGTGEARVETPELGPGKYVTWSDLLNGTNGVSLGDAGATVSEIDLVVDGGYAGAQQVNLSDVQIADNQGVSEYVPGNIAGSGPSVSTTSTPPVTDNSQPAWISIVKISSATPTQVVDEGLVSTQGDQGGAYRQVDSMYMYNLPVSDLPDPSATYAVGVSFSQNGSPIPGAVNFGLK